MSALLALKPQIAQMWTRTYVDCTVHNNSSGLHLECAKRVVGSRPGL